MKFIFLLLALFLLTDPVLAKPATNSTDCLQMYQRYINTYGASQFIPEKQMLNFYGHCLPTGSMAPVNSAHPKHKKLLRIINGEKRPLTSKV